MSDLWHGQDLYSRSFISFGSIMFMPNFPNTRSSSSALLSFPAPMPSSNGASPTETAVLKLRSSQQTIRKMVATDLLAIEGLLDLCFGPDRHQKTAQLLRDGNESLPSLDHVATDCNGDVVATIRYWPVEVDTPDGPVTFLWLGPLAVHPSMEGQGLGGRMMRHSMAIARQLGFQGVLLIGDAAWYQRFGFSAAQTGNLSLPGDYDPARLLVCSLQGQPLPDMSGMIRLPWSMTAALAAE